MVREYLIIWYRPQQFHCNVSRILGKSNAELVTHVSFFYVEHSREFPNVFATI